jgi:hypothetical protein
MDNDNPVGLRYLPAMTGDDRVQLRISRYLLCGKDRVEPFGVQVVEKNVVAVLLKDIENSIGDCMVETPRMGVGEDDRDVHRL